jgi:ribonucleoside-diphosphate reductase alpha chain
MLETTNQYILEGSAVQPKAEGPGHVVKDSSNFFTKQQVYTTTLEYFKGDDLATNVWIDKYCLRNKEGKYLELTPDDMHKRLARELARIEQKYPNPLSYDEIYNFLLRDFKYIIPGGSILYGIGNTYSVSSLGNCFVIGNNSDSYGGICTTDQELCQLFKRRSGVGHDISHLRPDKTPTTNAAGYGTGPVSFMERYSHTARETAQSGRRGAQMITIDINHPDIEQFITCKDDLSKITGANISVKITDEFMKAVEENTTFILKFPESGNQTQLEVWAKPLWDKLIHQAWKSAEPGVLFWDKIKSESIPSCYGKEWEERSTNP